MNLYMTSGTYDFLERLAGKHAEEHMVLMSGEEGALLLHETEGKTVFASPRKYEVLESSGSLGRPGLVVMNNIPVTDEGRPVFEYRFKNRAGKIENTPGFQAIRVLRPIKSNTYVILTAWDDELAFQRWKESAEFGKSHGHSKPEAGPSIFSGQPYITKYSISESE
ncbi:antibiotic biosynthesis monooxygenase [Neobacillus piezotolerans]|uniref:Antibiotic biosynthesis monooxygenase n=1 Tax=Neobacillus piezotolerans TaxID=2259171 RepID=A0A3D8GMA2_9BACI|nr:antibiotic biosynthesis monooxygenase [Neobacillus piezotolerans]RDU35491.1 antibiotic biosynthesis monooxygenase [Neobacillus piezotolerans]